MKKFFIPLLAAVLVLPLFAACGEDSNGKEGGPPETVTVTFVQAGQENVTREVEKGETLTDVPSPAPRTGYTVAWERNDFSEIEEDITVNAVETANSYTVTLDAGNGTVASDTLTVTYDAAYELPAATWDEKHSFTSWLHAGTPITSTGTWKIAENVTLVADWADVAPDMVTVTFVQSGHENVTREVEKGSALTDIPAPQPKTGYTVKWDRTDFSEINENLTVNAIETANSYTVTYLLGEYEGAEIESETMEVTYDETYNLYVPTCKGNTFLYWVIDGTDTKFTNGTWNRTENVTLRAVWKFDEDEWSEFY